MLHEEQNSKKQRSYTQNSLRIVWFNSFKKKKSHISVYKTINSV